MTRQIFGQVVDGIDYIHNNQIAHRDMKLENCFIDKEANIKIADFGF